MVKVHGTFEGWQITPGDGQVHNLCPPNVRNLMASFKH